MEHVRHKLEFYVMIRALNSNSLPYGYKAWIIQIFCFTFKEYINIYKDLLFDGIV